MRPRAASRPAPTRPARPRRGLRLIGPFVAGQTLLVLVAIACFYLLSATRAYVGGESQWSKSREAATQHLRRYAASGDARELAGFEQALSVPRGDRQARLALERDPPDYAAARAGFLQGLVHPADITAMLAMYRAFGHSALMRPAIAAWEAGDALCDELAGLAATLRAAPAVGDPASQARTQAQLDALGERFLLAEQAFSRQLGDACRQALVLCSLGIVLLAVGLTWAGGSFAWRAMARQRRDEERLRAANRRWSLATAGDGLGLIEWWVEGDQMRLDRRACQLYGLDPDSPTRAALARAALRKTIHPDDRRIARDAVERAALDGGIYKHTYRVLLPDRTVRHLQVTGSFDEAYGPRKRMVGIVRDVSHEVEHSRLEAERAAAESLQRERLGFFSRVSHELRTPLHAILGFVQLLSMPARRHSPPDPSYLAHLETASKHLLRLVDELLDLTSMQDEALAAVPEPVELAALVESCIAMIEPQRQAQQVELVHRLPAAPIVVQADPGRLRQVFLNLLSNGCKYNRPGGRLEVRYRLESGAIRVEIEDEGLGLEPHQLAALFQPFKRFHKDAAIPGSGLGLFIVKTALQQVGGEVGVRSEPGRGSVFTVRLNAAP